MITFLLLLVSCSAGETASTSVAAEEAVHPGVLFWGRIPVAEEQFLRLLEDPSQKAERDLGEIYLRGGFFEVARVFGTTATENARDRECSEQDTNESLAAATELWELELTPASPQRLVTDAQKLFRRYPGSCHVAVQWSSALLSAATQGAEVDPRDLERANRTYLTAVESGILPIGTLDTSDAYMKSMLLFESLGEYGIAINLARAAQQTLGPEAFEREFRSDYLETAIKRYGEAR